MRTWGLFLIPRDKAPDEGFMLTYTTNSGTPPVTAKGRARARWRAWWLPLVKRDVNGKEVLAPPDVPHYRAHKDIHALIDQLIEDHIA